MSNPEAVYLASMEVDALTDAYINTLIDAYINTLTALRIEVARAFDRVSPERVREYVQGKMEGVYQRVGAAAWQSMMSSYGSIISRGKTPSYRADRNRLPGALQRALRDKSSFYTADGQGLYFGNMTYMDQVAKHWRRITFGAGGAGHGISSSVELAVNGISLGNLSIQQRPREGFSLPPGFWENNQFTPYTHKLAALRAQGRPLDWTPTRGIETHDYLTVALRRMAKELPLELEKVVNEAFQQLQSEMPKSVRVEVVTRAVTPEVP